MADETPTKAGIPKRQAAKPPVATSTASKSRRPAGTAQSPAEPAEREGPAEAKTAKLLSGGNPQIAKGHGEAPV